MNITDIVYVMSFSVLLLSKICSYKYKLTRDIKFAIADLLFFFTHIAGILVMFSLSMKGLGMGIVSWSFLIIYFFLNHKIVKVYEKKLFSKNTGVIASFKKETLIENIEKLDRDIALFKNGVDVKKFSGHSYIKSLDSYNSLIAIYTGKFKETGDFVHSDSFPKLYEFSLNTYVRTVSKNFKIATDSLLSNSDTKFIDETLQHLLLNINKCCKLGLDYGIEYNSKNGG